MQPSPVLPAVEYAERSDPGRDPDKQVNEDACVHRETRLGHLCIVCDGMGGHAAGREAAELAVATVCETFDRADDGAPPGPVLKHAIEEASARVHVMRTSEVAMGRPGSTAVAVLMHAQGTEVAHVGDSRAFLVHAGQIFRLTRDHSMVQELVDRGLLTPAQAAHHPDANRITRALGMAAEVEAELRPDPVRHVAGDAFVLCSDGLSDLVEDHEILAIVAAEPAAQAVGKLVDLANARGGYDNVTVVVLRARETSMATQVSVAPTLAQTSVTTPPARVATIPHAPLPADTHSASGPVTQPAPAVPAIPIIPPAPEAAAIPPSSAARRRRKPSLVFVSITVVLALGAFALLGWALYAHIEERSGKRSIAPPLALPGADAQPAAPVPLVPESVVVPTASAPAEPIAPLAPSPSASTHRRH
ncbi:MAG TPA: protein phosphatase 2C domain-containing protein [Polyangiaceae bacterium]|jgi:protein phosphatase